MRVFGTVKGNINGLVLLFLVLALNSFLATYTLVRMHRDDEALIAQVHDQILFVHRLTWLVSEDGVGAQIEDIVTEYEENLQFVRDAIGADNNGMFSFGERAMLPEREPLDEALDSYRASLALLAELPKSDPLWTQTERNLRADSLALAERIEELSHALDSQGQSRHMLLLRLQVFFVIITALFTFLAYLLVRRRIVEPLDVLTRASQQIAGGDLLTPLAISGNDEIGQLAFSFEQMRTAILANQRQLEQNVAERTREIATAFDFSQEIVQQFDIHELVRSVTHKTSALMCAKDATVCLVTADGCSVELTGSTDGRDTNGKLTQQIHEGLPHMMVDHKTIRSRVAELGCAFLRHRPEDHCLSSRLQVGDEVIGAICVVRGIDEPFCEEESRAFNLLVNSAAIAISNARHAETAREQAQQAATQAERERLASELHDHLAQTLSLVYLKLSEIQDMSSVSENGVLQKETAEILVLVKRAFEQVRMMTSELATSIQHKEDEFDTQLALRLRTFEEIAGIPVAVTGSGISLDCVTPPTQKQILMIIGEALENVRRHAEASRVSIGLHAEEDGDYVTIEDDGKGFHPEAVQDTNHLGLRIMRTRAERAGGSFHIESAAGKGTQVTGRFPASRKGHH